MKNRPPVKELPDFHSFLILQLRPGGVGLAARPPGLAIPRHLAKRTQIFFSGETCDPGSGYC